MAIKKDLPSPDVYQPTDLASLNREISGCSRRAQFLVDTLYVATLIETTGRAIGANLDPSTKGTFAQVESDLSDAMESVMTYIASLERGSDDEEL